MAQEGRTVLHFGHEAMYGLCSSSHGHVQAEVGRGRIVRQPAFVPPFTLMYVMCLLPDAEQDLLHTLSSDRSADLEL